MLSKTWNAPSLRAIDDATPFVHEGSRVRCFSNGGFGNPEPRL